MGFATDVFNNIKDCFSFEEKQVVSDNMSFKKGVSGEIFITMKSDTEEQKFHIKNIIVDSASILAARLFKAAGTGGSDEPLHGAFCLALGAGNPSWDPFNPPAPSATTTILESELIRKQFSSVNYITPLGAVSTTPTNIVDFTTFFSESEAANSALMEMGLFGGDSTLSTNSGTMISYRTFKVLNKSSTSTLTIVWRLTF